MRHPLVTCAFLLGLLCLAAPAKPCSRVLWNDNGRAVLVGRNMDWFADIRSNLWVLPRGMQRNGLTAKNPLTWTSKYGSIALTAYDSVTADGVNEKKLAVNMLYLPETSTKPRDESLPGMSISMWVQYYLDNFATVAEAVNAWQSQPYQLLMAVEPTSQKLLTVHLALNDATGDSAILEYIDGKMHIYHNRKYTVMTNEPSFDKQLKNLTQYEGLGGHKPLPGSNEPDDRFVRAAFYLTQLRKPETDREAVAALMSIMRNVSGPLIPADATRPNVAMTVWRTVTDLTNGVLYFDGVMSPQVFWLELDKLNFDAGQPVRKLTIVDNFDLTGDVVKDLKPTAIFKFLGPQESAAPASIKPASSVRPVGTGDSFNNRARLRRRMSRS